MNSKKVMTALGLGALTVALIALPGSSARRKQDPSSQQVEKLSLALAQATDAEKQAADAENALEHLELVENFANDGDKEVSVIIEASHSWLGVGVSEVNAEKVKELKLPAERGVLLGKIVQDSPAAKAGLKENDVITEVNGQRVEGTEQFRRMIREIPVGRTAQVTVWRDGRVQTLSVTVGKSEPRQVTKLGSPGTFAFNMPEMPRWNGMMESRPWFAGRPRLGIDAEDLQGDFGNYFGAPDGEGILIRDVFPDTPAAKAGLKAGDVITSLNGERIRSVGELREKLAEKKNEKTLQLGLLRNKAPLTLTVEIPATAEKHDRHSAERTNI